MNWTPRSTTWKHIEDLCRWTRSGKDLDVLKALNNLPPSRPKIIDALDLYDAATERQRQIYKESCRIAIRSNPTYAATPPGGPETAHYADGYCEEMARFAVGQNESGFVKGLWTEIMNQWWMYSAPSNGGPYNPYLNNAWPGWPEGSFRYTWHLRLQQQDEPLPYRWDRCVPGHLPGSAYTDLNQWSDGRHLWGTPQDVWLLVPRGFTLRLYLEWIENAVNISHCGARMWGFTMPATSQAALRMAHEGWQ